MAIDIDTARLPFGDQGWGALLEAVYLSDPSDETEWLEHKAGVDPASKAGGASVAKAVAAFANRDPQRAVLWMSGFGLVIVGLEPGNVSGIEPIDPATLDDSVNRYLAIPRPNWDGTQHRFRGQTVLVVLVAPPAVGDPIAVIQKTGPGIDDGDVFVRRPGKSEPANHGDIRRLEHRANNRVSESHLRVEVGLSDTSQPVRAITASDGWVNRWLRLERRRLLDPIEPKPSGPATQMGAALEEVSGLYDSVLNPLLGLNRASIGTGLFKTRHEEDRTEEQFRLEVDEYLANARAELPRAMRQLRSHFATELRLTVRNGATANYRGLRLEVHIEGDVFGVRTRDSRPDLNRISGRPPRPWGPWTESNVPGLDRQVLLPRASPHTVIEARERPRFENGGSVHFVFPSIDLRPEEKVALDEVLVYAVTVPEGNARATWRATATNVDAVATGELEIPTDPVPTEVDVFLQ